MSLHTTPLTDRHVAAGAKLVEFGGWNMPISYPSGTLAEHRACRTEAVVFDVSHLGTVRVEGAAAFDMLQRALTNDLGKIAPGRAQYTHLLDDNDGSVADDIIVWWLDDGVFDVMPNASNTSRVVEALTAEGVSAVDTTPTRAVLAVQGPQARAKLDACFPGVTAIGRFRVGSADLDGVSATVAGTGYTGEQGWELAVPADNAGAVWDRLVAAGVTPAGLGARDTLRLEAGLPLHGQELGPGLTTLNARLGWVVAWDKPEFLGKNALLAQRERGVTPLLHGLSLEGRRPPRHGQSVLIDGSVVGEVSSGNLSPTLGHGIAMAYLDGDFPVGTAVTIDARGTELPGTVVAMPFYKAT